LNSRSASNRLASETPGSRRKARRERQLERVGAHAGQRKWGRRAARLRAQAGSGARFSAGERFQGGPRAAGDERAGVAAPLTPTRRGRPPPRLDDRRCSAGADARPAMHLQERLAIPPPHRAGWGMERSRWEMVHSTSRTGAGEARRFGAMCARLGFTSSAIRARSGAVRQGASKRRACERVHIGNLAAVPR